MMTRRLHAAAALAALCLWPQHTAAQPGDMQALLREDPRRLQLLKELSEISGLATVSPTSVLAHNDEHGIVYEIDFKTGETISAFALGDPTVRGDFEGIAKHGERVFLVTSTGLLYDAARGEHGHRVKFNIYDTGISDFCEVKGLDTAEPDDGVFYILCKTPIDPKLSGRLVIYRWSLDKREPVTEPWLDILHSEFLTGRERDKFRPSAIEWDAANERLIIISARNHMFVILNAAGELIYKKRLSRSLHKQAEGVAITADGALIIADESGGRGRGSLSIYERN